MSLAEISEAQAIVLKETTEFDEEWETVLYRICQKDLYLAAKAFQVSQLLNAMSELVPDKLDFGDEISKILGFSAVTSVNISNAPKKAEKFSKVRFEGWDGYEKILKEKDIRVIPLLKEIHDYIQTEYNQDLMTFNYAPNTLTAALKKSNQRSRNFIYIIVQKSRLMVHVWDEDTLIPQQEIKSITDFTDEMKKNIRLRFNYLSAPKI